MKASFNEEATVYDGASIYMFSKPLSDRSTLLTIHKDLTAVHTREIPHEVPKEHNMNLLPKSVAR